MNFGVGLVYRWSDEGAQPYVALGPHTLVTWRGGERVVMTPATHHDELEALAERAGRNELVGHLLEDWGIDQDELDAATAEVLYPKVEEIRRRRYLATPGTHNDVREAVAEVERRQATEPSERQVTNYVAACSICGETKSVRTGGVCGSCYWSGVDTTKAAAALRSVDREAKRKAASVGGSTNWSEWEGAPRECSGCSKTFTPGHPRTTKCDECRIVRARSVRKKANCPRCGKSFNASARQKYCSSDCTNAAARDRYEAKGRVADPGGWSAIQLADVESFLEGRDRGEFAERAGVSVTSVDRWLDGKTTPRAAVQRVLRRVIDEWEDDEPTVSTPTPNNGASAGSTGSSPRAPRGGEVPPGAPVAVEAPTRNRVNGHAHVLELEEIPLVKIAARRASRWLRRVADRLERVS